MKHKIEPKIRSLVDVLKKVPYIKTHSSCGGHFKSDSTPPKNENANVKFHVKSPYENEFMNLVDIILRTNISKWTNYSVEIYKRFYMVPNELPLLNYDWVLEIRVSDSIHDDAVKRKVTDEAISLTSEVITHYLSLKDLSVI